jgi:hypothetical protein
MKRSTGSDLSADCYVTQQGVDCRPDWCRLAGATTPWIRIVVSSRALLVTKSGQRVLVNFPQTVNLPTTYPALRQLHHQR